MESLNIKDFLNFNFLSNIEISEDNKNLLFVKSNQDYEKNNYISDAFIYNIEKNKTYKLTSVKDASLVSWLNNDTIIFKSSLRDEELKSKKDEEFIDYSLFYSININGGEAESLFNIELEVIDLYSIDENNFLIKAVYDINREKKRKEENYLEWAKEEVDYEVFDEIPFWVNNLGITNKKRDRLYHYNKKENKLTAITDEYSNVNSFKYKNAKVLCIINSFRDKAPTTSELRLYDIEDVNNIKEKIIIDSNKYAIYFADFIIDDDNKEKIISVMTDMKKYGLNENSSFYLIDENNNINLLYHYDNGLGNMIGTDCSFGSGNDIRVYKDKIYFVGTENENAHIKCLDLKGNINTITNKKGAVNCFDISNDNIYFIGFRDLKLEEIYSINNGLEKQLTFFNKAILKEKSLSIPDKVSFKTPNNFEIDGWVLKPINYDENKKYPAILDIHGGPKTAYGEIFFNEMQVWSNMGYFVFFCNPRGSEGKGNAFADIRKIYGTIDYEDIMKFTDVVLEKYTNIDKDRIGVTGGSYGGFMVNWIIGHTNRFKCAASQRSISNWIDDFGTTDIGYYFNPDELGGDVCSGFDKLWQQSPLKYANNAKTPTLFIHSEEDYRCYQTQAFQMFTALKYYGVESRICLFKGENHELSRSGKPKHRLRRLKEITDWFEKYLK
ncbi:S9 family peptidase [Brachyspira pilosicoli]|uniref:alpha/beta hydrolase family protein n=1 Tax=Brachyspira pilosicoli TaxID=52584 RepID=UPI001C67AA9C|nr:S9 family peptidase [Brachyspira pilosicoli]MBW5396878.1 S9 family peptidase [Brachyspira pilosicoli]